MIVFIDVSVFRDVVFEGDGSPTGHANMKSTQGLLAKNDLCLCVVPSCTLLC